MKSGIVVYVCLLLLLSGCVSASKYQSVVAENKKKASAIKSLNKKVKTLEDENKRLKDSIASLSYTRNDVTPPRATASTTVAPKGVVLSPDSFHTIDEKLVLYYINYVRTKPQEFLKKYVLTKNVDTTDSYYASLIKTLRTMKPVAPLTADKILFEGARCHAYESGKTGYVGHEHKNCKKVYSAECCAYASYSDDKALKYVLQLLVDKGVSSLGHRKILLMEDLHEVGISIQPHKVFGENVVLDFSY